MERGHNPLLQAIFLCALALPFTSWGNGNESVSRLWDFLRHSSVFRHDSFEPGLVVSVFFISIAFFRILDYFSVKEQKYWGLPPFVAERITSWRLDKNDAGMKTWKAPMTDRLKEEVLWYILPLAAFDFFCPRRKLPEEPPSSARLLTEVVLCLLTYDALFFCVHLACHKVPFLYKHIHSKHHRAAHVKAAETIVLSPYEEVLDVACSIAAINLLRAHPLSRALYNACIIYLLCELHSGYSLPWSLERLVPFGLWSGATKHYLHHQGVPAYYQKFGTALDWLLQTDRRPRAQQVDKS